MSNYLSDFDISGYGLSAQRFRMNVISSNIANANTVRTAEGGPYRRREVIFKAVDFDSVLNNEVAKKHNLLEYENPLDDKFYTKDAKPAIMSVVIEMADLIEATRAYQANVSAFQSAKTIAQSALELLQG